MDLYHCNILSCCQFMLLLAPLETNECNLNYIELFKIFSLCDKNDFKENSFVKLLRVTTGRMLVAVYSPSMSSSNQGPQCKHKNLSSSYFQLTWRTFSVRLFICPFTIPRSYVQQKPQSCSLNQKRPILSFIRFFQRNNLAEFKSQQQISKCNENADK